MRAWHLAPRVAIALLAGLVALDVTLVVAATRPRQVVGVLSAVPQSASGSAAASVPASSPGGSVAPTRATGPEGGPLAVMLMALDTRRAWRIDAGSCSRGGATLTTTVNGGRSWVRRGASLSRILRVQQTGSNAAFVIGAGSGCTPEVRETTDGGLTWVGGGDVGRAWFRDPGKPAVVWAPGPVASQPCGRHPVLDLAVISAGSARVLCSDGVVRSTTRQGKLWTDVATVDGAVAMALPAADPDQTFVARVGASGCPGIQVMSVRRRTSPSCVRVALPSSGGQVALSLVKGGGWLAVGEATMRSTDGLLSWQVS
jgi:hypothetical protein